MSKNTEDYYNAYNGKRQSWQNEAMDESGCCVAEVPDMASMAEKPEKRDTGYLSKSILPPNNIQERPQWIARECNNIANSILGVGPDAPIVVNKDGGKQSASPGRCDLLPPRAALHVAAILKEGAAKYGDKNWLKIDLDDHLNHVLTHIFAHLAGDTQDDHIGHAACRMAMALEKYLEGKR